MSIRNTIIAGGVLLLLLSSCATGPDPSMLINAGSSIKKVALLPLYVDPNVRNLSLGNEEVKGYDQTWKVEFVAKFKKRIQFVNNIQILYPGEDFDITPDMEVKPNYARIMGTLKVDMVMGFELSAYNEVSTGEKAGQMACDCLLTILGSSSSVQEDMYATYIFHNYYQHTEDWAPVIQFVLGGILTNEDQRRLHMEEVINWVDKFHPLSVNYKR